jgi:NitT/TauT family transport system substrate-binding protein
VDLNRTRPLIAVTLLAAVLAAALAAGCGSAPARARVVRLGYLRNDLHQLAYYVAREKGFFTEEGLDVREAGAFSAGPEEMSAFSAGDLDIGYVGAAPCITFVSQEMADVKIVAQANTNGTSILVRPGLDVSDVSGLRGRTVAIPGMSTMQDFILRTALMQAGVDAAEVKIIVVKPPEMLPALSSAQVDGAVVWEPYPSMAVAQNAGRVLINSSKVLPNHPCCMVVASSSFIEKDPDTVKRFVAAHCKATDYIRANPLEAADMAHLFTGQDTAVATAAMKNVKFSWRPDAKAIQRYVEFMRQSGVVKDSDVAAFTRSLVDTQFLPGSGQ